MYNLDTMSTDELMAFWAKHQKGRQSRVLFPNGGNGTRTATANLANYAINKATAISCRLRGDIETAQMYERIADSIYQRLPAFARW